MIPRLTAPARTPPPPGLLDTLVEVGFKGDLESGADSRTIFATDNSVYQIAPAAILALPQARPGQSIGAGTVVFVADAFTRHFDPSPLTAAFRLARASGLSPRLAPLPNGKPLHVHGYLDRLDAQARRTAARLQALQGAVLGGLDPSMTLTFRDEYAKLGLKVQVLLPQEWLAAHVHRLPPPAASAESVGRCPARCGTLSPGRKPLAMIRGRRI